MDFGATHRFLGRVNIEPILQRLADAVDADWDADAQLTRKLAPIRPTRSIFLYHFDALNLPRGRKIRQSDVPRGLGWEKFSEAAAALVEEVAAYYPPSIVVRCQIASLRPGGIIPRHFDKAPLLRASHRVHVPLITSPEVQFLIDDQPIVMEAGDAIEINNQLFHEVRSQWDRDRLHLIFDLLPEDYDAERFDQEMAAYIEAAQAAARRG